MEMHQVRYFVALCDTLNFTRAAERCNVSQPSLTRAIQLLEHELGGALFNRERNRTHLTELGRLMAPHLREVMAQSDDARRRARSFFELKSTRLKLGVVRDVPLEPLSPVLERFLSLDPDAEVLLQDGAPQALREALLQGELEVVVLPSRPLEPDELHYHPLREERVEIVLPARDPLAAFAALPLAEVATASLVCREGCQRFAELDRALRTAGLASHSRITVASTGWLLELVRDGLGLGVLASGHLLPEGLVSRPLADLELTRDLNLATKRGRLYSPPVRAFVDLALRPRRAQPVVSA
jgi:LysR family hydrogen peroxide-inducible transcriptional activator